MERSPGALLFVGLRARERGDGGSLGGEESRGSPAISGPFHAGRPAAGRRCPSPFRGTARPPDAGVSPASIGGGPAAPFAGATRAFGERAVPRTRRGGRRSDSTVPGSPARTDSAAEKALPPGRRAAGRRRRAPRRATIRTRRRRVIHGRIQSVGVPYPGLAGAHDRSQGVSLTSRRSANASPKSGASWRTPRSGETRSGRSASGASGPVSNASSGSSSGPMRRSPTPPSCSTSRPRTATKTPRGRSRRMWTASIPRSGGSSSGACSPGPWTAATPSWR